MGERYNIMHLGNNQYNLKGLKNEKNSKANTLFQEKMLEKLVLICWP